MGGVLFAGLGCGRHSSSNEVVHVGERWKTEARACGSKCGASNQFYPTARGDQCRDNNNNNNNHSRRNPFFVVPSAISHPPTLSLSLCFPPTPVARWTESEEMR